MMQQGSGVTALVVDDQAICRDLLRVRLERLGVTVLEASNGAEAVDRCQERQPHLAFMDIDMPVMCGLESTRLLRQLGFGLTIVGFSASLSPKRTRTGIEAGMDSVVGKHIAQDDLVAIVAQHADRLSGC